jgi:plasmid stability protein
MTRKLVSYRLADDLQQALKARASSEGISATELVNRLLRQGLLAASPDTAMDTATSNAMQQRMSQLEQVLHQLERRVAAAGDRPGSGSDQSPTSPEELGGRLLTLEQKLDALTIGVEASCRSLNQLHRSVGLADAPGLPGLPLSAPAAPYPADWSEQVVQLPLAALRKLLADQSE